MCADAVAHMIRTNSVAILVRVSWMPWMCECLEPCGSCTNGERQCCFAAHAEPCLFRWCSRAQQSCRSFSYQMDDAKLRTVHLLDWISQESSKTRRTQFFPDVAQARHPLSIQ